MSRKQKRTLVRILAAAALTAAAWLSPLQGPWRLCAFALPYLIVGWDVLWAAARNIAHGQLFDEKFLMTVATLGAFAIAEYPEAAAVMLFYQVGELFQSIAVGKSRRSIAALMDIRPDYAVVLRGDAESRVPPEEVAVGETIVVRPGERVPLDGVILEGATTLNTAALTGESLPSDRRAGERVVSGSINLSALIRVRTESVYAESTVAKILELVENASAKKARVESFITRFARWYTPCVVAGALLLALLPPLLAGGAWGVWINRALIFLVVSCPCALVVSVPLSFFGGIGGAARDGILIKGANDLEALAGVDTVVFDKTGTLTKGSFTVNAIHPESLSEDALLDIAAAAESYSSHPVAESILRAHGGHIDRSRIGEVAELAGRGLRAEVDGRLFFVGNGALMDEAGARWHECHLAGTVIHIAEGGEYLGHIVINDEAKPEAAEALEALRRMGVKRTVMLTGDVERAARAVAETVGVDEYRAGLLPAEKVEAVEALLREQAGGRLAFVGDGINDAPVLSRADVGVAMGALGSDAAIESADVVL
ncbi:MAG: heavy metal translocating P-type ATPase, partial [Clostridia bacterium]|nr:heavy metal translocating P-type ATPase [Clostridia bacterium]